MDDHRDTERIGDVLSRNPAPRKVRQRAGASSFLSLPHLLIIAFVIVGTLVGLHLLNNESQENCRAILTLSRNLFSELPTDPQYPEGSDYVSNVLPPFYYHQYQQMNKRFDLEDRCGDDLPRDTPPPPTLAKR